MAVLGAITRLTESGLSITEWKPLVGALPPLHDTEWAKAFADYQQIPQFKLLKSGMTLAEFKQIFFWEWIHRLWGRLIGFVFAVPFIYFLISKKIDRHLGLKLAAVFALGALQGFIGWFMVQSGLEVRTSVSPYRLALHLGFALLLYSLLLWIALDLLQIQRIKLPRKIVQQGWVALVLLVITIIWGAFVAGLHAGEAYNTWPLMEGEIFPSAALTLQPKWLNIFENLAFVQFIHRWLGPTTMLVILVWVWRSAHHTTDKKWFYALGIMAFAQVALGISTLLTHANIVLATLHQVGAIILLTLLLVNLWKLKQPA